MNYKHGQVQETYAEANKILNEAWSDSIDDRALDENAKLHALKTAVERLIRANIEKMEIARGE